jgi:putative ABC transport system permease protein
MLRHHLLIAYRNLSRHKSSFIINLAGLSTGLACAFLIYLWVQDELGFDKFHQNDKHLYQVMETGEENGKVVVKESTQGLLGQSMVKDIPEVYKAVSVMSMQKENMYLSMKTPAKSINATGVFADVDFFNIFSFPLAFGNAAQVLTDRNAVVLSDQLATSLFGSAAKAIGQPVEWELFGKRFQAHVTGVTGKMPANNSMKFDFVLTYDVLLNDIVPNFKKWSNEGPATYILLKPGTNVADFNAKIFRYLEKYNQYTLYTTFIRPYSNAYLYGKYENGVQAGGRIEYVRIISIVAIFILVIACINFMNLSTAKASRRLKEVGIKKTMGATRNALISQFISEGLLMAFLSLLVAIVIVMALLPTFSDLTGKQIQITANARLIGTALGVTMLTGLLAGSYPAFYLSAFNPVEVLKGKIKGTAGEFFARKGLVVFQFTISLVLIISVLIIYKQISFVQSKNLGYDKENIITFNREGNIQKNTPAFIDELKKVPGVVSASAILQNIMLPSGGSATFGIDWPGKTGKDEVNFSVKSVDYDLIETLRIPLAEGRSFKKEYGAEDTKLIFNETAIKIMGLKNPIGTPIKMWGKDMSIVGVTKDFHISSLHEPIPPTVFIYKPENTTSILARIAAGKEKETLARIETLYKNTNPGYSFDYTFLDDAYQAQYVSERRVSMLSRYFAGLAILISGLGLFGLAAFNAEIRSKEIGIRKVLGASVSNVMMLLSKDFVKLALIAIIVAFPIAWWAMNAWLDGFAYRIKIPPMVFLVSGLCIIILTAITVSYQSLKTALMNPVNSLRTE